MSDLSTSRLRWLHRRPRERRPSRLGQRGGTLLDLGILWLLMGVAVATTGGVVGRPPAPHEQLPELLREGLWFGTGLVAIGHAWVRTPGRDRWGFFALILMPAERTASWLVAFVLQLTDWAAAPSLAVSATGALVWGAVVRMILRIARQRETELVTAVR